MDEPLTESRVKTFPKRRWGVVLLCILALTYACWQIAIEHVQLQPSPLNSIQSVTAQDVEVYQSFLAYHPYKFLLDTNKNTLVCVNSTESSDRFPPLSQYCVDLNNPTRGVAPFDDQYNQLRKELYKRNAKSVPIPRFSTSVPVTFGPSSSYPDSNNGGWTNCDMHFSLPVYDADKSTALLLVRSETFSTGGPPCIYVMHRHFFSWSIDSVEWNGEEMSTEDR